MKTFKMGLYSSLFVAAAFLSILSGVSQLAVKAETVAKPVAATVDKSAAIPVITDLRTSSADAPRAPWLTPGTWRVIKTDRSSAICLYSDQQIKENIANNDQGDSLSGTICVIKRPTGWVYLIDAPSRANYDWDVRGLIDVEFTMKDGSVYYAHYWTEPDGKSKTMAQIGDMAEFKPFGRVATEAKCIKIRTRTIDGVLTQNFQSNLRD